MKNENWIFRKKLTKKKIFFYPFFVWKQFSFFMHFRVFFDFSDFKKKKMNLKVEISPGIPLDIYYILDGRNVKEIHFHPKTIKDTVSFIKSLILQKSSTREFVIEMNLRHEALFIASGLAEMGENVYTCSPWNAGIPNEEECVICFDGLIQCQLIPCKHWILCWACANRIDQCPFCRSIIETKIQKNSQSKIEVYSLKGEEE
jgi:hypothetical protein